MINILALGSDEQEEKLINGELDSGLMEKTTNSDIIFDEIGTNYLLLISNKNNYLETSDNKTLRLPGNNATPEIAKKANKFMLQNDINTLPIHYTDNIYSVLSLIELNINVTILPASLVDIAKPDIKFKN